MSGGELRKKRIHWANLQPGSLGTSTDSCIGLQMAIASPANLRTKGIMADATKFF
jgi:hypothetical protein